MGGVVVQMDDGKEEIVAPHWVTWCLPKTLAMRSLCALLAGITKEDQVSTTIRAKQKRKLYEVLDEYSVKQTWCSTLCCHSPPQ